MTVLKLASVSKTHGRGPRAVRAVKDVSLDVAAGELVLLEGPSGSGKTTLLTLAAGLLTPDSGRVTLQGLVTSDLSASALRSHRATAVGFVFQRANLLDGLNVSENVQIGALIAGLPPREARERTQKLLDALGIGALDKRYPNELSGGEEHRVAVARALVHQPAIVFADEPTGNLDSVSGGAVSHALAELAHERGVAVVIATHDVRLRAIATRRLWMEDGVLREESS